MEIKFARNLFFRFLSTPFSEKNQQVGERDFKAFHYHGQRNILTFHEHSFASHKYLKRRVRFHFIRIPFLHKFQTEARARERKDENMNIINLAAAESKVVPFSR